MCIHILKYTHVFIFTHKIFRVEDKLRTHANLVQRFARENVEAEKTYQVEICSNQLLS